MKFPLNCKKKGAVNDIATIILAITAVYVVFWTFTNKWIFNINVYNSYTLQALRWLQGHLDLGQNYSHLEIATFQGKFFVSFPPFPSVVLLPFALIFGTNTPDHLITFISGVIGAIYIYKIACEFNINSNRSIVLSLLATIASNFLYIGSAGEVWFMAQTFSFALTSMAIYFAINKNKENGWLSLLMWAFAVGCRPTQAIYLPILLYFLFKKAEGKILKRLWWGVPTLAVAIFYMALNYARFGNVLEFGHNYLSEFLNAPEGQFSFSYLASNLEKMFRLPFISFNEFGQFCGVTFPTFDGFAFYIVSPVFVLYFICFVKQLFSFKKIENKFLFFATPILISLHILLLCMHKTLGGFHFGNRYTIDAIPFLLLGLCAIFPKEKGFEKSQISFLFFGLALNLVGSIAVYNFWI